MTLRDRQNRFGINCDKVALEEHFTQPSVLQGRQGKEVKTSSFNFSKRPVLQQFLLLVMIFTMMTLASQSSNAACGATTMTWDYGSGNTRWNRSTNWNPNTVPNASTHNATVVAGTTNPNLNTTVTLSCLYIQSGLLTATSAQNMTIVGDYFRNLNAGNLSITNTSVLIDMAGTTAQTFENFDNIPNLRISNNSSVTLTQPFSITTALTFTGSTSILYVDADLTVSGAAVTIPAGVTVRLRSGAILTSNVNLTVNGTLILENGTTLQMGSGRTLSIGTTGNFRMLGTNGNVARLSTASSGTTFTFNMAGTMDATYFRIERTAATGMNVTGTIQSISNGEFHYLTANGYAMTFGAAAVLPATMASVGFYNDLNNAGVKNINASGYNLSAVTLDLWNGSVGGATFENDTNSKIAWGTQDVTMLNISNDTAVGSPPTTISVSSADTHFGTFAFTLNRAATATNITSLTVTQTGTATADQIASIMLFKDAASSKNCIYNAGVDTQVDTDKTMSGDPATATFTLATGDAQTNSDSNRACVHILVATSATALNGSTLRFGVVNTNDVVNSNAYQFSPSSGPPVEAGFSTVVNTSNSTWTGASSTTWATTGNWNPKTVPSSTRDCELGAGTRIPIVSSAQVNCRSAILQTGGTLNFNSTTNQLAVYGALHIQPSYVFQNSTSGVIAMRGAANQTMNIATTFPGNISIINTGAANNNIVSVAKSATVTGNITVTSGVLNINEGVTFTVGGNITVATGAKLKISPGGTLRLGNGRTLTVNTGGIFEIIGDASQTATITSDLSTSGYNVIVNGEISARYYTFDHLGTGGLSIESGATINATNHFQDGSFTYPVNNSMTFLLLKRQVPTNAITNINFSSNGSAATSVKNINTTGASAGTLAISTYSGNWSGSANHTAPTYGISWTSEVNTINITLDAAGPTTVEAGASYNMGRYAFRLAQAGSFNNTDITSLKLTLSGTGSAADVSEVRLYGDSSCSSSGGTLLGTGSFAGNPASVTFPITAGLVTVQSHLTTPPKNCVYVEYNIANSATNAKTVSAQISMQSDTVNSQSYATSGSVIFPLTLGAAATISGAATTVWTGVTNTDWFTATNWSAGLPNATKNCEINNVTNDPVLSGALGTGTCKNVTIGNGVLTLVNAVSSKLIVAGSVTNTGTINWNDGSFELNDSGAGSAQTLSSATLMKTIRIVKTGGGTVDLSNSASTIQNLYFPAGNTGEFRVGNGKTLTLTASMAVTSGTFTIQSGGTVSTSNSPTITVNGGTFRTTGTHDVSPQNEALKGKVTAANGAWGFNATSGTVSLVGFILDRMDGNGLRIGGTTTLTDLRGGMFTNLPTSYSTMKVMQLDSPNLPLTPADVEWQWGPNNAPPAYTDTYKLATSTGCGGKTITFDRWAGDFADEASQSPTLSTKISQTNCNIVISYANSPVSLTHFTATPYDAAVVLDWSTGNEWQHRGFNVYRSQLNGEGFVQINPELIRNMNGSLGPHGTYRFNDQNVSNGIIYSYLIEDIPITGLAERHGPLLAMPMVAYGAVPASTGSPNQGGSDSGADGGNSVTPGPIANDGVIDLGNGVHVLAKTDNSLRVEIIPPTAVFAASSWNASYDTVSVPGYAKTLTAGEPELAQRSFLIEVNSDFTTAEVTNNSVTESAAAAHKMQPAPEYTADANQILIPSYSPNSTSYSSNSFAPTSYYTVDSSLTEVSGKKYVKINVQPIKFNPVLEQTKMASKIVLDIGLDGQAWRTTAPNTSISHAPSAVDGALKVRYSTAGMFEVAYDDLQSMGLDGSLGGTATTELRGYYLGEEIPLEIFSADGTFNSGDRVRFWGDTLRKLESDLNEVVITRYDLLGNGAAKRFVDLDANPTAYPSPDANILVTTEAKVEVEENHKFYNDRSLGDLEDHFFWERIGQWNATGDLPYYEPTKKVTVNLPRLIAPVGGKVRVVAYLRGRAQYAQTNIHHVGLWINAVPYRAVEQTFDAYYKERVVFELAANLFVPGDNEITFEVIPDLVPINDHAYIDIDRLEVEYNAQQIATDNMHLFYKPQVNKAINISGFSSSAISIYEISDRETMHKLSNTSIATPDAGASFDVLFALTQDTTMYRFVAVEDSGVKQPDSMSLAHGVDQILKDSTNQADLIVIGFKEFLRASEDLVARRRSEGLTVVTADVEQIYSEFSNGAASAEGIKEFLRFTYENWQSPKPKYVLFVGDATFDLKDVQGNGHGGRMLPIAMLSGQFFDFASDAWFANFDDSLQPEMAVGRIPARNTLQMSQYIEKLLAYESGERSPAAMNAKSVSIFVDADTYWEGFAEKATAMASVVTQVNSEFTTSKTTRVASDNASVMKSSIVSKLNDESPLVISLLGHGNEEMWSEQALTNTDAQALTNTRLPIMLGLACATGNFYGSDMIGDGQSGADPETEFLGEALVLNPNGGAIAYWGSPAYTVPDAQVALAQGFLEEISAETKLTVHDVRIGDLMLKSKAAVSDISSSADTVRSFTLLGDPTMKLPSNSFATSSSSGNSDPTAEAPAADKGGGCSGGGGAAGGCGTIGNDQGGGPSGPASTIFLLLLPLLVLLKLRLRMRLEA